MYMRARSRVQQLDDMKAKLAKLESEPASEGTAAQIAGLRAQIADVEKQQTDFLAKEAELERQEKMHPTWDVDTISKDKKSRTLINKGDAAAATSDPSGMSLNDFIKAHSAKMKEFGMMSKYEDSHRYLKDNLFLVCDHTAGYLVVWAIDMAVETKLELMKRIAHQAIVMQFILELARSLKRDPRSCVDAFFTRIKTAEKQYKDAFDDEYHALLDRIQVRAKERVKEAEAEAAAAEEEERKRRLGPGGLDPLEVLASLPPRLKEAFETQNTPLLHQAFAEIPDAERPEVYRRIVQSGLWVPSKGDEGAEGGDEGAAGDEAAAAAAP